MGLRGHEWRDRRRQAAPCDSAYRAKLVEDLFALGVGLVAPDPQDVHRIALRYGLSAYDAAYVALASAPAVTLWSGDRRMCAAIGDDRRARWIGHYPSVARDG